MLNNLIEHLSNKKWKYFKSKDEISEIHNLQRAKENNFTAKVNDLFERFHSSLKNYMAQAKYFTKIDFYKWIFAYLINIITYS